MATGIDKATCVRICASTKGAASECEWRDGAVVPASVEAEQQFTQVKSNADNPGFWGLVFQKIAAIVGTALLQIMGLVVGLTGGILNGVIFHTIVNISDNYTKLKPIFDTWTVVRDLANMSFIFILVYAGIMTMIGRGNDNKKVIVNVIIAAVLMNFSIFFTRVVIDIANLFALTFYDAMVPNTANSGFLSWGLSNAFMSHLGLSSLFQLAQTQTVSWDTILTIGVLGSAMLLVAAFIFAAVAFLLIIRYVVLILVIILSPIFFLSLALPKGTMMDGYGEQWKNALFGQAFFAPVYFFLTWVALRVMDGVFAVFDLNKAVLSSDAALSGIAIGKTPTAGTLLMIINFIIVIILIVAALTTSKKMADQAGGGMSSLTSWATAKAGGLTFGSVGRISRGTLGRAGQAFGDSEMLKRAQRWSNERGGITGAATGFASRKLMETGKGVGAKTFDFRAGAGKTLLGNVAGKPLDKGFAEYREAKAKKDAEFAASLGATEEAKARAKLALKNAITKYGPDSDEARKAQRKVDELNGVKPEELTKREDAAIARSEESKHATELAKEAAEAEQTLTSNDPVLKKEIEIAEEIKRKQDEINSAVLPESKARAEGELEAIKARLEAAQKASATRRVEINTQVEESKKRAEEAKVAADKRGAEIRREMGQEHGYRDENGDFKKGLENPAEARRLAFADAVENSWIAWAQGYNYTAAAKIRKGKSNKDTFLEAAKKFAEEQGEAPPAATPPPATPAPAPTPTPPPVNPSSPPPPA